MPKEIDYTKIPSVRSFGPIHWIRNQLSRFITSRFTLCIEGAENLVEASEGAVLCVAPHNGHADALLLYAVIRQIGDEYSKTDPEKSKIMDEMLKKLFLLAAADYWQDWKKAIPAHFSVKLLLLHRNTEGGDERDSYKKSLQGLVRAAEIIKLGGYVGIFPEGTRHSQPGTNVSDRELKHGLITIYEKFDGDHPIIPIRFSGTEHIWPKGRRFNLKKRVVQVLIGEPITSKKNTPGLRKKDIISQVVEFYGKKV